MTEPVIIPATWIRTELTDEEITAEFARPDGIIICSRRGRLVNLAEFQSVAIRQQSQEHRP